MPGRITFTPKEAHTCSGLPDDRAIYAPGTLWTCDECGQEWVMVYGSQYNESYSVWRKLTEKNRKGSDR
jgi:hypothetical protein